jgi:hypothetical protein
VTRREPDDEDPAAEICRLVDEIVNTSLVGSELARWRERVKAAAPVTPKDPDKVHEAYPSTRDRHELASHDASAPEGALGPDT